MEWTVQELAERAGISGRALRHYHRIGLLHPDRVGTNGYRYYGPDAVARLQRILLLRETGMPLAEIGTLLDSRATPEAEISALEAHLGQLAQERGNLDRRIQAVEHTLTMRREGREPRMDLMLDGFNDRYEQEVVERWGRAAFEASNKWWHSKSVSQQRAWKRNAEDILTRWRELHEAGHASDSAPAQGHAARHLQWFAEIPGTPAHAGDPDRTRAMVCGVADSYKDDRAFHEAFGSREAAYYAADALLRYVSEDHTNG